MSGEFPPHNLQSAALRPRQWKGDVYMSRQTQENQQNFSLKVIAQEVDFTYHAPRIGPKGFGLLGACVDPSTITGSGERRDTTVSRLLYTCQRGESGYQADEIRTVNQNVDILRDYLVALSGTTHRKVNAWYEDLKMLQRAALKGRNRAAISEADLLTIEEAMKVSNVGKVCKIRVQARWWSPVCEPKMFACRTGGYARVVTVMTVYVQLSAEKDIQYWINLVANRYGNPDPALTRHVEGSTVVFERRGDRVRTTVTPGKSYTSGIRDGKRVTFPGASQGRSPQARDERFAEIGKLRFGDD